MSEKKPAPAPGSDDKKKLANAVNRFLAQVDGKAKREYPEGRLSADDKGALAMALSHDVKTKTVVLAFGTPVSWFGLSAQDAVALAEGLIKQARIISDKPLVVNI